MKLIGLLVGGVAFVVAIVAVAWAPNDWLEKRGIANEQRTRVHSRGAQGSRSTKPAGVGPTHSTRRLGGGQQGMAVGIA